MRKIITIVLFIPLLSCTINVKKYSDDPKIFNGLEQIKHSDQKNLISYLSKHPASISFNLNKNQNCIIVKSDIKNSILLPLSASSNLTTNANIVKGLYYYRAINNYKIRNIFYEIELLSSYAQMEYILNNYDIEDIKKDDVFTQTMLKKLCAYILSSKTFDKLIYDSVKVTDYSCGYPMDDIFYYENYYKQIKTATTDIEGNAFFNLIYENYMEKVKRGELTREEAEKRYYYLLSEPLQELYRNQRIEITSNIYSVSRFKKFYNREIKKFTRNVEQRKDLINQFPQCLTSNQ